MTPQISIRSSFQYSDSLSGYIERRVANALRSQATEIAGVTLKLLDINGPRGGANDKVVQIRVDLKPWGRLVASAASGNIYRSVDSAASRLKASLRRHCSRMKSRRHQAADAGPPRNAD